MNSLIDLAQAAIRLPGHLADAAWYWAARKVMPLDVTDPAMNWEDEVIA